MNEATQYRLIVGERGNRQGHVMPIDVATEDAAFRLLAIELEAYRGDGWGRVEEGDGSPEMWRTTERSHRAEHEAILNDHPELREMIGHVEWPEHLATIRACERFLSTEPK